MCNPAFSWAEPERRNGLAFPKSERGRPLGNRPEALDRFRVERRRSSGAMRPAGICPLRYGRPDNRTFDNRVAGRCWFTPLSVKLSEDPPDRQAIDEMRFEGECALHG